jgi:all-trans-retinol 13,14-reductase
MAMAVPAPLSWMVRLVNRLTANLPLSVTQQYLKRRFRYSQLRTVVTSQWAGYGMPPGASAFATHAVIATHYLSGAWYPNGGASEIAKAAGAVIRGAGGALLSNHEVRSILLEGNRAVGVEAFAKKGRSGAQVEFRAPVIVSDAGAFEHVHADAARCFAAIPRRAQIAAPGIRGCRAFSRLAVRPPRDGLPRRESLDFFIF